MVQRSCTSYANSIGHMLLRNHAHRAIVGNSTQHSQCCCPQDICYVHCMPAAFRAIQEGAQSELTHSSTQAIGVQECSAWWRCWCDAPGRSYLKMRVALKCHRSKWHGTIKQCWRLLCRPRWAPHRTELPAYIIAALASSPEEMQQAPPDGAPPAVPTASETGDNEKDAAADTSATEVPDEATSSNLKISGADRGHGREEVQSTASANGSAAADQNRAATEAGALSEAEKAERRKAKKAWQRAARAQAAAQTTKVRWLVANIMSLTCSTRRINRVTAARSP